jgi:hypothetical protein
VERGVFNKNRPYFFLKVEFRSPKEVESEYPRQGYETLLQVVEGIILQYCHSFPGRKGLLRWTRLLSEGERNPLIYVEWLFLD